MSRRRPVLLALGMLFLALPPAASRSVTIIEYPVATASAGLMAMASGPVGSGSGIWFVEYNKSKIGQFSTTGILTEYVIPTAASQPDSIAWSSYPIQGGWFTEYDARKIGKIDHLGAFREWPTTTVEYGAIKPIGIACGDPGGAIWFTGFSTSSKYSGFGVGYLLESTGYVRFIPVFSSMSLRPITLGPDNNYWFVDRSANKIYRVSTASPNTISEFPAGAVSPTGITSGGGVLWASSSAGKIFKGPFPTITNGVPRRTSARASPASRSRLS